MKLDMYLIFREDINTKDLAKKIVYDEIYNERTVFRDNVEDIVKLVCGTKSLALSILVSGQGFYKESFDKVCKKYDVLFGYLTENDMMGNDYIYIYDEYKEKLFII